MITIRLGRRQNPAYSLPQELDKHPQHGALNMKKFQLLFSVIMVPLDYGLLVLAGLSAYYLRFGAAVSGSLPVMYRMPFENYIQAVLAAAAVWLLVLALAGVYDLSHDRLVDRLRRLVYGTSLGFVAVILYIFFVREFFSSRFIVLAAWLFAIAYLLVLRLAVAGLKRWFYARGIGVRRVVIIGQAKPADILVQEFSSRKSLGYQVVKRFAVCGADELADLKRLTDRSGVDEIIQADPNLAKDDVLRAFDFADEHHLGFKYAADLLGTKVLRVEVDEIAGLPVVEVKKTSLDGWGRVTKRLMDIIASGVLIILTSPITLITAIAIKLDSKGPIFFSRLDDGSPTKRVGQGGRPFKYFKFRSMIPNTHNLRYTELSDQNLRNGGPMVKIKDDPRVTRVGRFIRRYSIDELPELMLVFIGRMSLVGPRPHLPEEVALYERHHKKVLTIKPGITGLAQVSGRSDLSFEDEVRLDAYYIENWSILKDIIILFKTPLAVIKHRGAE